MNGTNNSVDHLRELVSPAGKAAARRKCGGDGVQRR